MERNENKMDTVKLENRQIQDVKKSYISPNLTKFGEMKKLTLKEGSVFDEATHAVDLP